ncbi:jasmonate Zim-domain protein [Striga asiatica]|uniref:Protein TIFY n=1 Tax=Striga asiatica TaxID=4170 RepID=A0A5A7QBG1_STRAF|nr:jasmonate Zim-domain protein [Striga asiatica]
MNLFPMIEKSGSGDLEAPPALFPKQAPAAAAAGRDETLKKPNFSGVESAQMTIFYSGQVVVFDDLPADKAKEILMLAAKSSGAAQNRPRAPFPSLHAAHSPAESATGVNRLVPTCPAQPPLDSDLPIARKNSLARFLEKRKDRITANAPYPANKPEAPSKLAAATSEPWMRLAPELIIQRH